MSITVSSRIHRSLMMSLIFAFLFTTAMVTAPVSQASAQSASNGKIIVGYWHNFDNGSTNIRLRDISEDFDVIQVSFAEPTGGPLSGNMEFSPYNATESEFKSDVAYLQSIGKKVLISIGGANGTVELTTAQAKQTFETTMKNIINTYGFDGMDIDLEGSSLSLNGGDTDFKNPTTPKITNLVSAIKEIMSDYGSDFVLTMAPETAYVQGGYTYYGGPWGAYLPVIHGLRNELTYLHVQHYNSGPLTALDGKAYSQGTADFQVAMAEMLLAGFSVGGDPNNVFPALRQDQILIGLPASPQAAGGGYTSVTNVKKALDYLIKGESFGGNYVLRNSAGYADMKGLMTWSINWDKYNNFEFSSNYRTYLDQFGSNNNGGDTTAPTIPGNLRVADVTTNSVSLAWDASTDDVGVTGYIISYGNASLNVSGTTVTINGLTANTDYSFTVKARDAAGNLSNASNPVTAKTAPMPEDNTAPTAPTNLQVTSKSTSSVSLSWTASTDNVGVTGYTVSYDGNTSINVTGTSATINGLSADTTYTFAVTAKDAAGNVSAEATIQVETDSTDNGGGEDDATAWAAGVSYKAGDEVTYSGNTYICRQNHTSLQGWEPANVPALWMLK